MKDLVSIIIPFYKGENYIKNAIESVLHQTYSNFELLLIENGPKDNSENIIKEYCDNRIKYYYIENGNVSNARNFGIKQSSGKFIYFMDGDDTIESNLLELCISCIRNKKVDLVLFNYYNVTKDKKVKVELPWKNEILNNEIIRNELIKKMVFTEKNEDIIMGTVWRIFTYRDIIYNIWFNEKIKIGEDLIFCIELYNKIKTIYVLENALYNYTLSSFSTLNSFRLDAIKQSIIFHDELEKTLTKANLLDFEMKKRLYKSKGRQYTTSISAAVRINEKKLSKKSINEIIRIYKDDEYNYSRLDYPISTKISFLLMKCKMTSVLRLIYFYKEKLRMKNYIK